MNTPKALTRIVHWSQHLLAEVLSPGALAVDLTAGNGHDTLFLFRCVGAQGRVLAFDIQEEALGNTARRLREAGAKVGFPTKNEPFVEGVGLVLESHGELGRYLREPPRAVIANLGYLPGGNPQIITGVDTTCAALESVADLLAPGGRLAVVVYAGHPGGREEADAVDAFFKALPGANWDVLRLEVGNRPEAPYLLSAEKRRRAGRSSL